MARETWHLGSVEVTKLVQFEATHPLEMVFDLTGAGGSVEMSYHSFVIRSEARIIVVDTCWGDRILPFEHGRAADLPTQLGRIGIAPGDVDVVICTHVHPDHVGWCTRKIEGRWTPTFPNARHLVTADELRFLTSAPENDPYGLKRVVIDPLLAGDLIDLVESDHVIDEHVRLIPLPGHTPGHVGVAISAGDEQLIIAGDVIMSPLQIADPTLNAVSEVDAVLAVTTRVQLLGFLVARRQRLLGSHFPHPTSGSIRQNATGFRWLPDAD